jgi:multidrug efflux system membrane fusion protein
MSKALSIAAAATKTRKVPQSGETIRQHLGPFGGSPSHGVPRHGSRKKEMVRPVRSQSPFSRLTGLALSMVVLCGASSPLHAQRPPPEVTVAHPVLKAVVQWDEYTGQFEAVQRVEIRARVSGELVGIHFTDGQVVTAGDLLFTIDPRPFEIAVEAARADVARAKAQVAVTKSDLDRAMPLTHSQVLTQRDFDQRTANYETARAQLQAAEASLRNAMLNLEWASVRAPIGGRISDRKVDVGNLISGGQTNPSLLTTIVSIHPIHFVFNVPEPDLVRYARLAKSQEAASSVPSSPVAIRLADEKDWQRTGRINFVDNQLNGKSGTIRVRAVLDNEDHLLTPGTFGRLRLAGAELQALLIPDAAVVSDQTRKVVYVVGADNKIQAKAVTLGPIDEALRVIATGLTSDDRVVVSGLANPAVRPGLVVAPVPASLKSAAADQPAGRAE